MVLISGLTDFEIDLFQFLKGIFQGDPLSGVIFLIVFNIILGYIKTHKEEHGYLLSTKQTSVKNVITTPFARTSISYQKNIKQHQTLVTDVGESY